MRKNNALTKIRQLAEDRPDRPARLWHRFVISYDTELWQKVKRLALDKKTDWDHMSTSGDIPEEIRAELIRCCRRPGSRTYEWTSTRPTVWQPTTVTDPRSPIGLCFSDLSAWSYIADLLDEGTPVRQKVMEKPLGAIGYEMEVHIEGRSSIYIKVELSGGRVIGRSFHNSAPLKRGSAT